ncbi:MAG: hypothetical protein Q8L68_05640 [Methylococcales bacterium]|nr:hypothetical protein [Methylococcales bacterium]
MDTCIGSQLYEKGWKQGAYIECTDLSDALRKGCWAGSPNLANDLVKELSETRNTLILLTQACDVAASCNNEPTLEFVIARRPKKKQPPYPLNLDARSSRYLELEINGNWYKAEASKIVHISKKILFDECNNFQPSHLSDQDIEVLARWRANRYMRVALPDAFNNKIKPLIDQGLFDDGLEHAGGLYLSLEPFTESEQYIVRLFALQRQGSSEETFSALFDKMESVLSALNDVEELTCPFIEGESISFFEAVTPAMRRHELSIDLRDHFVRWNFDYISLKDGDSNGIDEN